MDYDRLLTKVEGSLQRLLSEVCTAKQGFEDLKERHQAAVEFTSNFLGHCKEVGITRVSVSIKDKSVPSSMSYPFGCSGSVFAFQPKGVRKDWPPIWGAVEAMGIGGGCGNHDQYQLSPEGAHNLIDGVYHLRKGVWKKIITKEAS